jgi:hypothetical protein
MGFLKTSRKPAAMAQAQADQAAAEAAASRQREVDRQNRLTAGAKNIDNIFGGIPDSYYNGVSDNIKTLGGQDLTSQFNRARENLQYALARSGLVGSSVANDGMVDINTARDEGAAKIGIQATQAANKLRQQTDQEKQSAMNQLYATENPDLAANTALTGRTLIMQDKPSYSPIGDIFGAVLGGIGSGLNYVNNVNAGKVTPNSPSSFFSDNANERIVSGR